MQSGTCCATVCLYTVAQKLQYNCTERRRAGYSDVNGNKLE